MSILKNENLKNLAKLISFYLFKTYESSKNKKIIKSTETFLPKEKKKFLLLLLNSNLLYVGSVGVLSGAILKDVLDLSHPNQDLKKSPRDLANQNKNLLDLANQNKNLKKLTLNIHFFEKQKEKRILAMNLGYQVWSKNSINKYVIFKKKNKNNLS